MTLNNPGFATLLLVCAPLGCGNDTGATDASQRDASVDVVEERVQTDADPFGDRIDQILQVTGDARQGRALYSLSCTNCHDKTGEGVPGKGVRVRDSVERLGERAVLHRLLAGAGDFETDAIFMPHFRSLANQTLADLLAYLKTGFVEN